jgi:hypothetical protein
MFSIHYNASLDHSLYGAEVWIPSDEPYMKKGLDFAIPMLHYFDEEGLFIRGAKTRINSRGRNYYGIIREATARGIPCVIIEHCHVDHENDVGYCASPEDLIRFGQLDAQCIAGYLGLSKDGETPILNNDFAGDESSARNTLADPLCCDISVESEDDTGVVINVKAEDADSLLLYYDYTTDGGSSFTQKIPIPGYDYFEQKYDREFSCRIDLDRQKTSDIYFRVYNTFNGTKVSKCIRLEARPRPVEEEEPELIVVSEEFQPKEFDVKEEKGTIILWVLLVLALSLTAVLISLLIRRGNNRNKGI